MKWLFNDWFEYSDNLFFFHSLELCPGKLSEETNKISYAPEIDNQIIRSIGTIERTLSKDSMAFLFPVSGNKVVRIDMDNGNVKDIPIDANQEPWDNYAFITIWKDCIYIFPRHKSEVIVLEDISSDDIQSNTVPFTQKYYLGCQTNDEAWLFPDSGDRCVCFNLSDNTFSQKSIDIIINDLISVDADEESIYCFDKSIGLIKVDKKDGKSEILLKNTREEEFLISLTTNRIILLPVRNNEIKIVDKGTGASETYSEYPYDFEYIAPAGWGKYLGYKQKGDKKCFALRSSNYALCIDTVNDSINWDKPVYTSSDEDINYWLSCNGIINENSTTLNKFIDYLKS